MYLKFILNSSKEVNLGKEIRFLNEQVFLKFVINHDFRKVTIYNS
jgi:hypothetical protein